jgi:hypothetical protein
VNSRAAGTAEFALPAGNTSITDYAMISHGKINGVLDAWSLGCMGKEIEINALLNKLCPK